MSDQTTYSTVERGDAQAVIDAALASAAPHELPAGSTAKKFAVVVPHGGQVRVIDVDGDERYGDAPRRTQGIYTLDTVDSFVAYVKAHQTDSLTVWVQERDTRLTAVFNDATPAAPAWRDHRAVCDLTLSEEWLRWSRNSGKLLDQQAFAEHIEDGLAEIIEPDAATMLEIAQSFQAHTTAEFQSGQRLDSGQVKFRYDEEVTASAGTSGEVEIPEELQLAIPVFLGEDAYRIKARFRYRLNRGVLTLGYKLEHPERVLHDAIELIGVRLTNEFATATTDGEVESNRVYLGAPPAAATA